MKTSNNISQKPRRKDTDKSRAEWSSEVDSDEREENWQSNNEWNEDSSSSEEASALSEETDEPEDQKGIPQREQKSKGVHKTKLTQINLDDVGTEDDGESRHPEDITDRIDEKTSKTDSSDLSDMSEVEDQIAEAQNKFLDDRQSLRGVMGLVDEVTMKGEELTRKASETSVVVERDTLRKGTLSHNHLSSLDDDDISFASYTEKNNEENEIPQTDLEKNMSGRIEYINNAEKEKDVPKLMLGTGHIEYLRRNESDDSGSLISEEEASSDSNDSKIVVKGTNEDEKCNSESKTQAHDLQLDSKSRHSSCQQSSESHSTEITNQDEDEYEEELETDERQKEENSEELVPTEENDNIRERYNSPEFKEFEDPACSKLGEKHLCCFFNLGGGGDGRLQNELVNRLKKLKDDIANMRKELSAARQECKKESEEVAKLIEAAAARNKAAEQNEIALPSSNVLSTYNPQFTLEEMIPTALIAQATILPSRTQVAIPSSLLEDRLRTTRQTASSTYRESLNELERMVEMEIASIKDSMTRLEPLNKISAEWDAVLPVREPKRTTYKSDYRMEMVTSEMLLKAPELRTTTT